MRPQTAVSDGSISECDAAVLLGRIRGSASTDSARPRVCWSEIDEVLRDPVRIVRRAGGDAGASVRTNCPASGVTCAGAGNTAGEAETSASRRRRRLAGDADRATHASMRANRPHISFRRHPRHGVHHRPRAEELPPPPPIAPVRARSELEAEVQVVLRTVLVERARLILVARVVLERRVVQVLAVQGHRVVVVERYIRARPPVTRCRPARRPYCGRGR